MWDDLFDKKFREAANEGLPSLDQSQIWNNISRDLDKHNNNRKFAWLWFFGAFILMISASYFITKNHISFVNKNFESISQENNKPSASTIAKPKQSNKFIDKNDKSSSSLIDQNNNTSSLNTKTTTNSDKEDQAGGQKGKRLRLAAESQRNR